MNLKEYLSYYKVKSQREEKLSRSDVAGVLSALANYLPFPLRSFLITRIFCLTVDIDGNEGDIRGEEGKGGRQGTGKWMRNKVRSLRLSFTCQYLFALPVERRLLIQPKSN